LGHHLSFFLMYLHSHCSICYFQVINSPSLLPVMTSEFLSSAYSIPWAHFYSKVPLMSDVGWLPSLVAD
jgi:hypothetical protein